MKIRITAAFGKSGLFDCQKINLALIAWKIKGIHLYLPPTLWTEFLSQWEDISLSIWFSGPDCDSHLKGKSKNFQYVRVPSFLSTFGHLFSPFNPVFILISKKFFFEIGPKLTFLRCFFHGIIFFVEEFLLSQKIVFKMWINCEKNSNVIWNCE